MNLPGITPQTPTPQLRRYVKQTYWLQGMVCLPVPLLLASIASSIESMRTSTLVFWVLLTMGISAVSYALFDAAAILRVTLQELIRKRGSLR